jgi:hypothetical protein
MATRTKKRKTKKWPLAFERHRGYTGKLYRVSGERVVDVHGAIVGQYGFIFKERTKYGRTPQIATIVNAGALFTDPKKAAESMKTRDGFALTYNNDLVPCKVVTHDGRLHALDETGSTMHCSKVFLSAREAASAASKDLVHDLSRERAAVRETIGKLAKIKRILKKKR